MIICHYWWLFVITDYYYYGDYLLLLMIICYYWWLLLIIICYCNKINFSSSIYKVIRPVLNFLFFYNKISQVQKSIKKNKRE